MYVDFQPAVRVQGFEYLWIQSKAKRIEIWQADRRVINSTWCGGKGGRLDRVENAQGALHVSSRD